MLANKCNGTTFFKKLQKNSRLVPSIFRTTINKYQQWQLFRCSCRFMYHDKHCVESPWMEGPVVLLRLTPLVYLDNNQDTVSDLGAEGWNRTDFYFESVICYMWHFVSEPRNKPLFWSHYCMFCSRRAALFSAGGANVVRQRWALRKKQHLFN